MKLSAIRRETCPARPARLRWAAATLAWLIGAGLAGAQSTGWYAGGTLDANDPTWQRPYLFAGQCYLSTFGTDVPYDLYEIVLDTPTRPIDLALSLCSGTAFDSVLLLYQRADGAPVPFDDASPCTGLIDYNDDYCGTASRIDSRTLVPGHITAVVTGFRNTDIGDYGMFAFSNEAPLPDFIYYSGFETGDSRTWSATVSN